MKIYAFADEASPLIDGQITAMRQNGVDGLEIRNVDGVNIAEISDRKAKEVRKKLDDAGLRVWTIGSPIGKIDIEKDSFALHTEKFCRTLELAEILGAENIRLFSFFTPAETRNDYEPQVMERLAKFVELAKSSGITLCHENEKGIFGDTPERCVKIHQALPELKAIFDPANYIQCEVNTLHAWKLIKPYVKYLHIKDCYADGSVVPAGKGVGHLPEILADYRSMGGECVTIEPHLTVFDGLADLEKEGEQSAVGQVYRYQSHEEAFAAAVAAFKELL